MEKRQAREQGAAAVEMALLLPLLVMILFGIVVFGLDLFRLHSMEAAVREGGRVAAVGATVDTIQARVMAEQQVIGTPAASDFVWQLSLDGTPYTGSGTDTPCRDVSRGQVFMLDVRLSDPASYAFYLPIHGDVAPRFTTSAAFRCE